MIRDAVKTLFHPFATGTLAVPGEGNRILFLAAEAGPRLPEGFAADIVNVQPLRPLFRPLSVNGAYVVPEVEGDAYDGALILCGKHKGENEENVAQALTRVKEGGLIVLAGSKEDGVQPLRKQIANLGFAIEHMPKYHGVVAWFTRPADVSAAVAKFSKQPQLIENRFETVPGTFSHDRIDAGSELLASRLPRDFDGNAADLGAGLEQVHRVAALGQHGGAGQPGGAGADHGDALLHRRRRVAQLGLVAGARVDQAGGGL